MGHRIEPKAYGEPVRWGILGTGRVAHEFAAALRFVPGARLTAIGSRAPETAASFAAAHEVPRAHDRYEALAEDPNVDIVYVATPHARHRRDCLMAIGAGKAVLCEKPFALDAAEAEEVIGAARRRGVFCMEAMWTRFMPAVRKAYELVRAGSIGRVRMLAADFGVPTAYDPADRLFDAALGGGALLDRGVYPLSLALELFGMPTSVQSAVCFVAPGVDEHVSALLRYAGGEIASISATLTAYASNEAVLVGTEGRLTIHEPLCRPDRITLRRAPSARHGKAGDSPTGRVKAMLRERAAPRRIAALLRDLTGSVSVPYEGNGYVHEIAEASRCLREGRTESRLMPLDDTLNGMRILDMIRAQWPKT